MVSGLQKYSGSAVRRRASIPKLLVHNTALMSAVSGLPFADARNDPAIWGRLIETAVGAHFLHGDAELHYWRERNREVDYVVRAGKTVTAFEGTSGRAKHSLPGMGAFQGRFPGARLLLVGGQGIPLEEFLSNPADSWVR